jgi:hypothetical protein
MSFDLQFRDEMQKDPAPPASPEPAQEGAAQGSSVTQTLPQLITPGTQVQDAAQIVHTMTPAQQDEALVWINDHVGALYATRVSEIVYGEGKQGLGGQMESLGESVGRAQRGGLDGVIQERSTNKNAALSEGGAQHKGKERLATYQDPLLGEFEVLFDLDAGLSASLTGGTVRIVSGAGLTLKTPEEMPDITIYEIVLDLASGEVEIKSDPEIGEFEERLLGGMLKESVLAGVKDLGSAAGMAEQLGLEVDNEGNIKLYDSWMVDLLMKDTTQITASLSGQAVQIGFSEPILVDVLGPDYFYITAVKYDFASASVEIIYDTSKGWWASANGAIYGTIAQWFGNDFIRERLPEDMKEEGYSPARDSRLAENFNALLGNFMAPEGGKEPQAQKGSEAPVRADAGGGAGAARREAEEVKPLEAEGQAGQEVSREPIGEDNYEVVYAFSVGGQAAHLAVDKGSQIFAERTPTEIVLGARGGLFVVTEGAAWARALRLEAVRYQIADGSIQIDASEEVGEAVERALAAVLRVHVLPQVPEVASEVLGLPRDGEAVEGGEGERVVYRVPVEGLGEVEVVADKADTVGIEKSAEAIWLRSRLGLRARVTGASWIPELVLGELRYGLKDGSMAVSGPRGRGQLDVGPLVERVLEALVKSQLLPMVPEGAQAALGVEESSRDGEAVAAGRVIIEQSLGSLGKLDVSLTDGDTIGFRAAGEAVSITTRHGLLVRIPQLGVSARLFDLRYDPESGQVSARSEPPLGSYEEALLSGAVAEFVMPALREYMATHDEDLTDSTNVLYRAQVEGMGSVKICVEAGDAIQVERSAEEIALTSQEGIFWLAEGELGRLLPENRIRRVSLSLVDGQVKIDADADFGPLAEAVATQLVQVMVLPQLDEGLREKLFGGRDPLQSPQEAPPAGVVLYEGDLGGVKVDVSLPGAGDLAVTSRPDGSLHVYGGQGGILLRAPSLGLAITLLEFGVDPATGAVTDFRSSPEAGAAEVGLIERAVQRFARPLLAAHFGGQAPGAMRAVASVGGAQLQVAEGEALVVQRTATHLVLSASSGIQIVSDALGEAPPKIQQVRYALGTGQIDLDLVNVADGSVYQERVEVSDFTEDVLSNLVRGLLDPYLTPGLRRLGLAGEEAKEDSPGSEGQRATEGAPWLEVQAPGVGRVQVFTQKEEQLEVTASQEELVVRSSHGIRIALPDQGLSHSLMSLRYHFASEDVEVVGLGRLENQLLGAQIKPLVAPLLSMAGVERQGGEGPVAQALGSLERNKDQELVIDGGGATLHIPQSASLSARLSGDQLVLAWSERVFVDGPFGLIGNMYFRSLSYQFGTGEVEVGLESSNLFSATGTARKEIKKAARGYVERFLPEAMRAQGYDLFADPERARHLEAVMAAVQGAGGR